MSIRSRLDRLMRLIPKPEREFDRQAWLEFIAPILAAMQVATSPDPPSRPSPSPQQSAPKQSGPRG